MKNLFYFCVLIFNATFLLAQETQTESTIDEIIVTAEFNDVDSYNLSSSISVITENEIFRRNANHLEDLLFLAPNINYSTGASRGKFYQVRGIGERSEFTEPVNYSVGVIIDGIDFNSTLTRAKFEQLNAGLFQKCLNCVENVLRDSKISKSNFL